LQIEEPVHDTISKRLEDAPVHVIPLVRAALHGGAALEQVLSSGELPAEVPRAAASPAPVGAYLNTIRVEGFRGIGDPVELEINPGPGLTLVIGRNGSGKSSFAEALEILLTDDNPRWAKRSAVWKEGWRNLHHDHAEIGATLGVEGFGLTTVRRTWRDGGDLGASTVEVQPHGEPKTDLSFLDWREALKTHRPFLSYSELGAMLDEGPTKLHDAVSVALGLDELADAEKALRDSRLTRERRVKEILASRDEVVALLEAMDDERAARCVAALRLKIPALDTIDEIVLEIGDGASTSELAILQKVIAYEFPREETVSGAASELTAAQAELVDLAGTEADRLLQSAGLLESAVGFRSAFGDSACPVCGTEDVLTDAWAEQAQKQAETNRKAASDARRARTRLEKAVTGTRELIPAVPQAFREAREVLDLAPAIEAWKGLDELRQVSDPVELARDLPQRAALVREAVSVVQKAARSEVQRKQDAWRPVALNVAVWAGEARAAFASAERVNDLKAAEAWLKTTGEALRNERFVPIADAAMEIWGLLRQRSNVELGRIELAGTGVRRRITLDVTVDGAPAAALGVMSQGELHALALSLFFPRATLDESPFRFIVVDDPVQSMDPAKVDGLAKVLERAAAKRQVLVFTHDDRLPEAIRRLGIEARIVEVSRRERSRVELREALTPIERHIADARSLTRTENLPEEVARRVVPGFCRLAIEAASMEAIRRRRIGRGDPHADVEELLSRVTRVTVFASLALFDDPNRGGDVLGTLNQKFGKRAADAFVGASKGVHEGYGNGLPDLVRDSAILARELAALP
jgi:recombinational DNA repair ATPase RecF